MGIRELRASLNRDALKQFDNTLSNFRMEDNVDHTIVDYDDPHNFVVKAKYNTKPTTGLVFFRNGIISDVICR